MLPSFPRRRLSENEFIVIPGLTRNPETIEITGPRIKACPREGVGSGVTLASDITKIDSLVGGNPETSDNTLV